jgi:TolB-like protein
MCRFRQGASRSSRLKVSVKTKGDTYFADGVQDEILNNLAKIAQLKVISRTSVMQYRADVKRDLRQIANALGVTNILEPCVEMEIESG